MLPPVIKLQVPAKGNVKWVTMEVFAKDHVTVSARGIHVTKLPELARVVVIWDTMERTVINLAAHVMHRVATIELVLVWDNVMWVSMAHNATLCAKVPVSELVRKQLDFA